MLATALSPPPASCDVEVKGLWTTSELMEDMGLEDTADFSSTFQLHLHASGFPPSTTLRDLVQLYLHTFSSMLLPSSPYLCVHYEHQLDASSLGSSLFTFDALTFHLDLRWLLSYWTGERHSEGVLSSEHWKCQRCEYIVECTKTQWEGRAQKVRERKEEERREKEELERLQAAKRKEEEEEREREKQRQRQREQAQVKVKAEPTPVAHAAGADNEVMEVVRLELDEDGKDEEAVEAAVLSAAAAAAKVRRGRKRRSLQELTMTPPSGKGGSKDAGVVKAEGTDVIHIDCV